MGWIRFDEAIFQDDWYVDLTDAEARAWLHFILYSGKERGFVPKMSFKLLSRHIIVDESVISSMLEKALLKGKLVLNDSGWEVCNFNKYNPSMTNSERQARYRGNKSNNKVTPVTESNGVTHTLHNGTLHNDTKQNKEEEREQVAPTTSPEVFEGRTQDPSKPPVHELVINLWSIGEFCKIKEYYEIKPEDWDKDIAIWESRIGKERLTEESRKFKNWMLDKYPPKNGKTTHTQKGNPRQRLLNNWLGKIPESEWKKQRPNENGWWSYDATDPFMYLRNNCFEGNIYVGERQPDGTIRRQNMPP